MKYDVFCVGEMVIDFTPGKEPNSYIANPGGAPANAAIAVSRLGRKSAFCGMLGADTFGDLLQKTLEENGVYTACHRRCSQAVTTLAFVSLTPSGERSFTFARKPGADMFLEPSDIDDALLRESRIVHAGSCSLSKGAAREATQRAMHRAKELGKLVSFDINYRDLLWDGERENAQAAVTKAFADIDLLKLSDEEESFIGGWENIETLMRENEIALAVMTRGADGAEAVWKGKHFSVSGRNVPVADTNGAGDAFWGGFLATLSEYDCKGPEDLTADLICRALETANMTGSLTVQRPGAIPALPYRKDVLCALEAEKSADQKA